VLLCHECRLLERLMMHGTACRHAWFGMACAVYGLHTV
jgi:hypothetical protein